MKLSRLAEKPVLLFSPFLLILITVVLVHKTTASFGDESRYLTYANNLLHGFYSPPSPDLDLGDGPGYPLFLIPFIGLRLPLISITLMNAFLYFFSIILLYKSLLKFVSIKIALIFSLFFACYINAYENVSLILPETLAIFLVCSILFVSIKAFNNGSHSKTVKYLILAGLLIGYLALVKPIFGYVFIVMLIFNGIIWIINRKAVNYRKGFVTLIIALATASPYLIYTYHLTGKVFYWSSFGGDNLYWMSTPYEGEYGNWYSFYHFKADSLLLASEIFQGRKSYNANHLSDFQGIKKLKGIELDSAYKKIAIRNIKSHPQKFIKNCICNLGRIIFNFPYSYKLQSPETLLRLPFNGIIMVLGLFCLIPTLFNWRKIAFSIRFLFMFTLVYIGGSILGSAETRMFSIIVPVLLLWIAFIIQRSIEIRIKIDS
jgi:4-amino-4-deoxy-L-arabinose transferase-like glycosyltransferase